MLRRFCTLALYVLFATIIASPALAQSESVFAPGAKPTLVLETGAGEGPAWHPQYGLFFSGSEGITLLKRTSLRAANEPATSLFLPNSGSNGLLFDQRGELIICQPKLKRVSRMNLDSRELTVLTNEYQGQAYNQPNDVTVDSHGRIYFSDPRYGSRTDMEQVDDDGRKIEGVYRIDADKSVTRIIMHEVDRPNGLIVTADDKYLLVADNNNNMPGGARKLWRFNLQADGSVDVDTQKLMFDWKTGRGPDGMVLDELGRLYVAGGLNVAHPPHETSDTFKAGVYVFSLDGKQLDFVPIPRDEVTNCTFGGPELKTLFITAGGTLWSIPATTPGRK